MVLYSLPYMAAAAISQKAESPSVLDELLKTLNGLGFILILISFLVLLFLAFLGIEIFILSTTPNIINSTKKAFENQHRRSFLWGLAGLVLTLIAVMLLGQLGDIGGLLALVLLTLVTIFALFGLGGVSSSVGEKALSIAFKKGLSPAVALPTGLIVLGLATLLPGIGWFIFLPYLMAVSLGSFLQARFTRKQKNGLP